MPLFHVLNLRLAPGHDAADLLRADAAAILAAERQDTWMEARMLTPIYLRIPQAERERNARLTGES